MAEAVTFALVDEIKCDLERLHHQPELDARDRHSIFIINDMLSNLSFCRERQSAALAELISNCNSKEQKDG